MIVMLKNEATMQMHEFNGTQKQSHAYIFCTRRIGISGTKIMGLVDCTSFLFINQQPRQHRYSCFSSQAEVGRLRQTGNETAFFYLG